MLLALALTALMMGLTGGPHCLVMCAAPCAALTRAPATAAGAAPWRRLGSFHLGRLVGYALAGAAAAQAMQSLVRLGDLSPALRPLWTLMHVVIFGWGLMMLLQARQPAWLEVLGRGVWRRLQPLIARASGLFVVGLAWALLPCGLLYSALLMAALSGSAWAGAVCMLAFAAGSAAWLLAGPWLWERWRQRVQRLRGAWGARLAGVILMVMGSWALWMDVVHGQPAPWCVV